MSESQVVNFRLTPAEVEKLDRIAERRGLPWNRSAVLAAAIRELIAKESKK